MNPTQLRATLKLRSFPPHGIADVQRRTLARLHRLTDVGTLTSVDVDVWGSHAVTDSMSDHDAPSIEDVFDYERWAEERGYSLAPAFARRESGSMIDDSREVTVVPLMTLAVYDGDRLRAVYPHADGERVRTIADGLETLEAMALAAGDRSANPAREGGTAEDGRERLPIAPGR